jgi:hypothetical protein
LQVKTPPDPNADKYGDTLPAGAPEHSMAAKQFVDTKIKTNKVVVL